MESLVVSLDTAKKLKAAGFPQEAYFRYAREYEYNRFKRDGSPTGAKLIVDWLHIRATEHPGLGSKLERIAAPTATEIADQLPYDFGGNQLSAAKDKESWLFRYGSYPEVVTYGRGDTMAEALAALWLRLQEATK